MANFLIPILLASTVAAAAPAAAQWVAPAPQGYAYGYNNQGQVRRLEARVAQLRRQIQRLDRRGSLGNREARRLEDEARFLQQRIRQASLNGISGRERSEIERSIARLENRIHDRATGGERRFAHDRDRDGRDDRHEDDRGRDHDEVERADKHDRDHDRDDDDHDDD
ncbi:MAG TPA: hypothetical protein VNI79_05890 [Sphingomicrobium sp.]|nr:hypothetical protein [Sphingomicrobium sp.]